MYIELKSAALARGLQNVHDIPPRATLPEIVCRMVAATEGLAAERSQHLASAYLESGRELYGFLQAALRAADLDRTVLPSCQGSGFEAWRLLHERYKPVTSGGMIGELREIILKTNLFIGDNIESAIYEWERKLQRFTSAYRMQFPSCKERPRNFRGMCVSRYHLQNRIHFPRLVGW